MPLFLEDEDIMTLGTAIMHKMMTDEPFCRRKDISAGMIVSYRFIIDLCEVLQRANPKTYLSTPVYIIKSNKSKTFFYLLTWFSMS